MKICKSCGEEKDIEDFYNKRNSCKDCVKARASMYQKNNRAKINAKRQKNRVYVYNPEKSKEYAKRHREKYKEAFIYTDRAKVHNKYKVSEEFIRDLMDEQGGCCSICGCSLVNPDSNKNYCIDHDHTTGIVRGLLCSSCNCGIGFLKDDINLLHNAIRYLENK